VQGEAEKGEDVSVFLSSTKNKFLTCRLVLLYILNHHPCLLQRDIFWVWGSSFEHRLSPVMTDLVGLSSHLGWSFGSDFFLIIITDKVISRGLVTEREYI
jgi:hypothetical protein